MKSPLSALLALVTFALLLPLARAADFPAMGVVKRSSGFRMDGRWKPPFCLRLPKSGVLERQNSL